VSLRPDLKYTYDDFLHFPNDGRRHEIIDGEHYVTPSPNLRHQRIARKLLSLLDAHVTAQHLGEVFMAPFDVVLTDLDIVEPDLFYISAARAAIVTDQNVRGAPDLVIEVLSPSTHKTDEVTKRKLYDRCGVLEYWVIDPELETVKVYRRSEGAFARVAELSRETGDHLTTPLMPELTVALDRIFQ
jgi:Uma2 family endonuclease